MELDEAAVSPTSVLIIQTGTEFQGLLILQQRKKVQGQLA